MCEKSAEKKEDNNTTKAYELKLATYPALIAALVSFASVFTTLHFQSKDLINKYEHELLKITKEHDLALKKSLKIETCKNIKDMILGLSGMLLKDMKNITSEATASEMAAYNIALIYLSEEHKTKLEENPNYSEAITRMIHSSTTAYVECINL